MKLLIITHHKLSDKNGGAFASRAFIDALADCYEDTTLIFPDYGDDISNCVDKKIKLLRCSDKRSNFKKLIDVYCGVIHRFENYVKEHLETNKYDVIAFDRSVVASNLVRYIKTNCSSKVISIHHNVENAYYNDNPPPIFMRVPFMHYMWKAEVDAVNYSDLNLTITQQDADYFCKINKNKKNSIVYWGTFEYKKTERKPLVFKEHNNIRLVISGSLGFPQSEDAILYFLETYYAHLHNRLPNIELNITGRNPSKKLQKAIAGYKSVRLVPNPEDISLIISEGNVYVCPLFGGSGVKLRVMDGLKQGLPVLCDYRSTAGYEELIEQNCVFPYSNIESFVSGLQDAIKITDQDKVIDAYLNRFSYNSGVNRLKEILAKYTL
ncbi:MAG: glycosyltransferase [Paludibacteraceae bacterium]|nr:glycosyltransferase [Paludibacteraceae bacterium]